MEKEWKNAISQVHVTSGFQFLLFGDEHISNHKQKKKLVAVPPFRKGRLLLCCWHFSNMKLKPSSLLQWQHFHCSHLLWISLVFLTIRDFSFFVEKKKEHLKLKSESELKLKLDDENYKWKMLLNNNVRHCHFFCSKLQKEKKYSFPFFIGQVVCSYLWNAFAQWTTSSQYETKRSWFNSIYWIFCFFFEKNLFSWLFQWEYLLDPRIVMNISYVSID